VALVQSKLVHHQKPDIVWIEVAHAGLQAALIDDLDLDGESADMADRQRLQQRFAPMPLSRPFMKYPAGGSAY